jgi:3-oxosteroid 1-dehydrogenase
MADYEADILVVGSGAGGMTAAVTAAAGGARVLVVEKSALWGGTSATSGGFIWIPVSHLAKAAGADDSEADAFAYIRQVTDEIIPDATIWAFVRGSREMLSWLETNSHVRCRSIPYADYRPEVAGAKLGYRTHDPVPLDGRLLGPSLDQMRPSAPAVLLFNRLAFTMDDVHPLLHRPPGWWRVLLRVLARYYLDVGQRLRSRRNRFLAAGNALLGRLRLSLDDHKAPLWLNAPLVELIQRPGDRRIVGAVVMREGQPVQINVRNAVILASGGFEYNAEMRRTYLPQSWNRDWSGSIESNTGDGLAVAQKVGAASANLDSAWWGPMLKLPDEDRARLLTFERALPGCIIVNQAGRRFMNEASAYDVAAVHMLESDRPGASTIPSYFLFDGRYRNRYPIGPIIPRTPDWIQQKGARQILVRAQSWSELADRTGIPADALNDTISRFNAEAVVGKDTMFGRGDSPYDRYYGDPKVTPNPNLAPLDRPPFYAIPVYPGDIGTNGGIVTDENAQVLDQQHAPIPGLYAVGNVTASVMGHSYPGAGATLAPAMTFGYLAARHAIRQQADGLAAAPDQTAAQS